MIRETYIIGVTGGSGSGKTFFANALQNKLGKERSYLLYQDHYYKDQSHKFDKDGGSVNFDHPDAIDFDLLASQLKNLKEGNDIRVPKYDFKTHSRMTESTYLSPKRVIILDGILILSQPKIRELLDDSIFVDTPENIRFKRRLLRDTTERGRTPEGVEAQFNKQVKPMHDMFVETSKVYSTYTSSGVDMEAFYRLLYHINKKINYLIPNNKVPLTIHEQAAYLRETYRL